MTKYESGIISQIKDYLSDTTYRYAVMLTGEWGIGKTYFIKEMLIPAIENDDCKEFHVKYISLYGCNSREKIREMIVEAIISDCIAEKSEMIEDSLTNNTHGEVKKKREKKISIAVSAFKRSALFMLTKKGMPQEILDIVSDVISSSVDLSEYFIIVDDVERCLCPSDEILGALNEIVEQDNAKLLIIANEKEIGGYCRDDNLELKYFVASNRSINADSSNSGSESNGKSSGNQDLSMSVEDLRKRADKIFSEEVLSERYVHIREKLVGVIINYEPDIVDAMHMIIANSGGVEPLQKILDSRVRDYKEYMEHYRHKNLRTFQFFISRARYLYNSVTDIPLPIFDEKKEMVYRDIIWQCFIASLCFKADIQVSDTYEEMALFGLNKRMDFIDEYIKTSRYVKERAQNDIAEYVEAYYVNMIPESDPYTMLKDSYYLNDQEWVYQQINGILKGLQENNYPVSYYGEILSLLISMEKIGFVKTSFNEAYDQMASNIEKEKSPIKAIWSPKNRDVDKRLDEAIDDLNDLVENKLNQGQKESVLQTLQQQNWVDRLREYLEKEFKAYASRPLFERAQVDIWMNKLIASSPAEIYAFQRLVYEHYKRGFGMPIEGKDMATIKAIIGNLENAIDNDEVDDLIKKQNLKWLCDTMKKLLEENGSEGDSDV